MANYNFVSNKMTTYYFAKKSKIMFPVCFVLRFSTFELKSGEGIVILMGIGKKFKSVKGLIVI